MGNELFSLFQVLIGAYLLYCGVTGKGKIYENTSIKEGMEARYKKHMRIMSLILAPLMLAQAALDYFVLAKEEVIEGAEQALSAARIGGWVLWGLTLVALVFLFIFSIKMTDRTKPAATGKNGAAPKSGAPRAAFFFDDEDEKDKKDV